MKISLEQFEKLVGEAIDSLPEKIGKKLNNVAIFASDQPTSEQLKKIRLRSDEGLFGLFEGYCQGKKLNFGPVLPDRITIFRKAISNHCRDEQEIRQQIISTVKHEIAHHFGSDELGARKASRKNK